MNSDMWRVFEMVIYVVDFVRVCAVINIIYVLDFVLVCALISPVCG